MKDKFGIDIKVRDVVMYTSYDTSWRVGMVCKVRKAGCTIFERTIAHVHDGTQYHHTYNKRSSEQLIVLDSNQAAVARATMYPFIKSEYMKTFDEYMDTLK